MNRAEGKVVVITGGAQGMGASHARVFAEHGGHVVIADRDVTLGSALVEELGESAAFHAMDVTAESDWDALVAATIERFGRLDVLVNNAGLLARGAIEDSDLDSWNRVIGVNLTGVFLGMRAVVPIMKSQGSGSIINISSVDGIRGSDNLHAYVASKFGVTGITKSVAVEIAASGVRVNSVHPGLIETPMSASMGPTRLAIPMDRGATADEVSMLVLYLGSDESRYCTGAEFVIDGGLTAGIPHRDVVAPSPSTA